MQMNSVLHWSIRASGIRFLYRERFLQEVFLWEKR